LLPLYGIVGSAVSVLLSYFVLQWVLVLGQYQFFRSSISKIPLFLLLGMQCYGLLMAFVSQWYLRMAVSVFFAILAFIYLRSLSIITQQDILRLPLHHYPKLQTFLLHLFVSQNQQIN